jgi:DNA-binding HxlR family transcriptional regulator
MWQPSYGSGLEAAWAVIGGKWKPLIVWQLAANGPRRFSQLRRLVDGISEKMLISTLKELGLDGIVVRTDFREVPPRVEYSLTEFGLELSRALLPLGQWGSTHTRRISRKPAPRAQ